MAGAGVCTLVCGIFNAIVLKPSDPELGKRYIFLAKLKIIPYLLCTPLLTKLIGENGVLARLDDIQIARIRFLLICFLVAYSVMLRNVRERQQKSKS